ncbi:MAG: formylglycine-generating enzyme family protein [Planctomycetota bacterium]|jgi:hypothetical protein
MLHPSLVQRPRGGSQHSPSARLGIALAAVCSLAGCQSPEEHSGEPLAAPAPDAPEGPLAAIDRPAPDALEPFRIKIPATGVRLEFLPVPGTNHWLARTETTWDAYDVFTYGYELPRDARPAALDAITRPSTPYGSNDRGWGHRGFPALTATATAAEGFATWLSELTGGSFRLPTEDEWQAAALAGQRLPDSAAVEAVSIDRDLSPLGTAVGFSSYDGETPAAVKTTAPNDWGFLGLVGNVGEWAWVDRENEQAVLMGGHILDAQDDRTPWRRELQQPSWNSTDPQSPKSRWWLSDAPFVGFRILCEQAPPADGPAPPEPLTP